MASRNPHKPGLLPMDEGIDKGGINDAVEADDDGNNNENMDQEIDEHSDDEEDSCSSIEYSIEDNEQVEHDINDAMSNNNDEDADIDDDDFDDDDDDDDLIDYYDDDSDDDDFSDYFDDDDYDSPNNCKLQRAIIEFKGMDAIQEIMKLSPMEIKHKNTAGNYPLHTACEEEGMNDHIALTLMEQFPEAVQHMNVEGYYPLHLALMHHRCGFVVMKLIEIFPDAVKKLTPGGTALHFACIKDQADDVVEKLIEIYPIALQQRDCNGSFPIHCAIRNVQEIPVVKILLDNDPIGMQRRVNDFSYVYEGTTFHLACQRENDYVIEYLITRSDLQINIIDREKLTPLHYACRNGNHEIVEMILNHPDVEVNAKDFINDTPLHHILQYVCTNIYHPESCIKVIKKLLNQSFILIDEKNNNNITPMDMIKKRLVDLDAQKKIPYNNLDGGIVKREEFCREIIHLLEEFPVVQRWKAYCYHVKEFFH